VYKTCFRSYDSDATPELFEHSNDKNLSIGSPLSATLNAEHQSGAHIMVDATPAKIVFVRDIPFSL
jgi:hypothetical protein